MIDWARVIELHEEIGSDDFAEVVDLFLAEVEERLALLAADDTPEAQKKSYHFLKGSALNLGFRELANLCHSGEHQTGDDAVDPNRVFLAFQAAKQEFSSQMSEKLSR